MVNRLTLLLIPALIAIASCDSEPFEPDLAVLKSEIAEFYEQQSSGDLAAAMEHFDQFPYERDYVESQKKKFLEQNKIGRPEFNGCRIDVAQKYHTRGRLIWIYCDVARAANRYSENHEIAAIYPSMQSKFKYRFQIGRVYYEDLSKRE